MSAPDFIKNSPLSDNRGFIDVNPITLQHLHYPNIFGLGDAFNAPASKTDVAIRKQAPVIVRNLQQVMKHEMLTHHYDGYTSCPVITGYNKLILAEFDYNKKSIETMPFNQAKERRSTYHFKKDFLSRIYWYSILKGRKCSTQII